MIRYIPGSEMPSVCAKRGHSSFSAVLTSDFFSEPKGEKDECPLFAQRDGFTLTELLVVIFIMGILAGLAAFFWPGFNQRERAAQGASNLHNWLLIARQRALLDQAPRGVRLFPDPNNPNIFTKAQFIEQPDDFTGGTVVSGTVSGTPSPLHLTLTGADPTGGFGDPTIWPVQPGDYLQVNFTGLMHQIVKIEPDPSVPGGWLFTLASPVPNLITAPANYRIVRTPRLQGEEAEEMPSEVALDFNVNTKYGKPLPINTTEGTIDILFSPNGNVLGNAGTDKLIFWIRDISYPTEFEGNPSLVVLYTQTGLIAGYEAGPSSNPFIFVK